MHRQKFRIASRIYCESRFWERSSASCANYHYEEHRLFEEEGFVVSFLKSIRNTNPGSSEATKLEGIFRISGDSRGINSLKEMFDTLGMTNTLDNQRTCINNCLDDATLMIPDDTDPHAVSGLLKLYFRELPAPLLTYSLYPQWIQSQSKCWTYPTTHWQRRI